MPRHLRPAAVLALLLVVCTVAAPASAAAGVGGDAVSGADDAGPGSDAGLGAAGTFAAQNNSTSHENPEEAAEDGDAAAVERWLSNDLGERLEESTIELSEGRYETAKEFVGDDYSERVKQLVDVEGDTDGGDGSDSSSAFERAQENQRGYVSSVQEYRETRERYETAKRNGNQTGARRLARRLNEVAEGVNDTGATLVRDYANVSNASDRNLDEEARIVENITANVTATQREIREVEFLSTNLSVDLRSSNVSFLDPIVVTGRVTTETGTPLADETVELQVGERTTRVSTNGSGEFEPASDATDDFGVSVTDDGDIEVSVSDSGRAAATTNESGTFRLLHRPTVQPLDESRATVRFVPAGDSVYLGMEETVEVDIEQAMPNVSIDEAPSSVAFGEATTVNGSVAVEGVPADGVPVVVSVGDTRLGVARTDGDGEFSLSTPLPAAVRSGSTTANASLPLEDRALAPAGAGRSVTVRETDASLTLSSTAVDSERVRAAGTLSADGEPIADQTVEIRVNRSVVETVRTNETGAYDVTAGVPAAAREDGAVRVTAVYATDGTNLGDARAAETLLLDADDPGVSVDWRVVAAAAFALVVALAGGASLWRRRRSSGAGTTDRTAETTVDTERPDPEELSLDAVGALDAARTALSEGRPDRAVELAYGDVRRRFGDALDVPPVRTHWEFYRACRDAGLDGETVGSIERLTEAYERAAYAPESPSREEASAVVDAAADAELSA